MSEFDTLYQKAVSDPVFLQGLANDTAGTLQSIGITPTPALIASVQSVLSSVQAVYGELTPPLTNQSIPPFVS